MSRQYYLHLRPRLQAVGYTCEVVFSDTDSFCLRLQRIEEEEGDKRLPDYLEQLRDIMDFSNYDPSHPLYNQTCANLLGYWKDELKARTMIYFCGSKYAC